MLKRFTIRSKLKLAMILPEKVLKDLVIEFEVCCSGARITFVRREVVSYRQDFSSHQYCYLVPAHKTVFKCSEYATNRHSQC